MHLADEHLCDVLAGTAFLLFDGAMGTMLQAAGLKAGELPELLNLTNPEVVRSVHRAYVAAGSEVVSTNTFGANARKLAGAATVDDVFAAAVACARQAGARYVAADLGPTGALLKPLGTMDFDEAYDLYAEQVRAACKAGADILLVETMSDLLEAKAAVLACKENSDLPVFASMTFGEDGATFLGTSPEIAAMTLSALGVAALGINCSQGPKALSHLVARMRPFSNVPLMVQANAGLPHVVDGTTVFEVGPAAYAQAATALLDAGTTILGGCCGTTPDHIRALDELLKRTGVPACPTACSPRPFCICSAQRSLVLQSASPHVAVIGERINPTGKTRLKEALRRSDYDYVVSEALDQKDLGADVLDINVGLPELDEPMVLARAMERVQEVCDLPLQIDSSDPAAIERAVRRYAGKPLVNSVSGKAESLESVLPLAAKYGCAVVGLTLDENGIPPTAEGRFDIARRIVEAAQRHGIPREDVVIDCLAMAASTNPEQVPELLQAIRRVKAELGVKTVLGVSNISFGLPQRELVNAAFLASAFGAGLDLAIMNPKSQRMRDVVAVQRVLTGQDDGARAFIETYAGVPNPYDRTSGEACTPNSSPSPRTEHVAQAAPQQSASPYERARHCILTGRKAPMPALTQELLAQHEPLEVVNDCFVPVLNEVGELFERGELFLPQLMASAEAVKAGFETVKTHAPATVAANKGGIVLATVQGDVHDIGKNIVKMLLENYGFDVIDLGRDVAPQTVVDAVLANGVRLAGLSALMTTTVQAMEETVALIHDEAPLCKVMVGGAVLTPEYARMVGADCYAKDAAEAARLAVQILQGERD